VAPKYQPSPPVSGRRGKKIFPKKAGSDKKISRVTEIAHASLVAPAPEICVELTPRRCGRQIAEQWRFAAGAATPPAPPAPPPLFFPAAGVTPWVEKTVPQIQGCA